MATPRPGVVDDPLAGEILAGGITISLAAAADLVAALNRLEAVVYPILLNPRLATLRVHLTRAVTRGDASMRVVAAQEVLAWSADAVADTTEVAQMLNITTDTVRWHCRHGALQGKRVGGRWMVVLASVDNYRTRTASGADSEGDE